MVCMVLGMVLGIGILPMLAWVVPGWLPPDKGDYGPEH